MSRAALQQFLPHNQHVPVHLHKMVLLPKLQIVLVYVVRIWRELISSKNLLASSKTKNARIHTHHQFSIKIYSQNMKIRIILQIIPILTFILSRQIHHLKFHKSLATYKFILQAAPFFVWGFSSSQGIYYTSQTLERFSTFEWKSFSEKNPCHHCSEFWDRN